MAVFCEVCVHMCNIRADTCAAYALLMGCTPSSPTGVDLGENHLLDQLLPVRRADVWQVLFTSEMRVGVTKRHLRACTKPTANCDFDAPPNVGLFTGHEVVDPHSYVGLNINRKLPNPL